MHDALVKQPLIVHEALTEQIVMLYFITRRYLEGHSFDGRLTPAQDALVLNLSKTNNQAYKSWLH